MPSTLAFASGLPAIRQPPPRPGESIRRQDKVSNTLEASTRAPTTTCATSITEYSSTGWFTRLRLVHSPICEETENHLRAKRCMQHHHPAADVAHLAESFVCGSGRPDHHERDDEETDEMRHDAESAMAKSGAENELYKDYEGEPNGQCSQRWSGRIIEIRQVTLPPVARHEREAYDRNEKYLRDWLRES